MPIVGIQTTGGNELGVATDEGVFFLGRTAAKGPAKVLYYLGPSPLVEAGDIEDLESALYKINLEVPVPTVPISFEPVQPGERLLMMGLDGERPWAVPVAAAQSPLASGTCLHWPGNLGLKPEFVGAGVFRETDAGLALVGLLKGTARIEGGENLLLLAGLPELRQALLTPKEAVPSREVKYRADGVRTVRIKR